METAPTEAAPTTAEATTAKTTTPTHLSALAGHTRTAAVTYPTKGSRPVPVHAPSLARASAYLPVKASGLPCPPLSLPRHPTSLLRTLSGRSVHAPFSACTLSSRPL